MGYRVAVVGATGMVGREMLAVLAEHNFPIDEIKAVASHESVGRQVSFGEDQVLEVVALKGFDFTGFDFAFFSAGSQISAEYSPRAAAAGCTVIDNSSHFRQDPGIPLVVPEVNPEALESHRDRRIIANPNCVALPLTMVLKPLLDEVGLKRVVVSTYQSVSGAGQATMDELFNQTRAIYMNQPLVKKEMSKQIAFNVVPHIGPFLTNGDTGEEEKVALETQKILGTTAGVAVTCVRVPVFIGHAMTVAVELNAPLSVGEARALWREFPGLSIIDHRQEEGFVTSVEVAGEDDVFISRIRRDKSVENGLLFWVVSDNLRKGAALNAIQIAEMTIQKN